MFVDIIYRGIWLEGIDEINDETWKAAQDEWDEIMDGTTVRYDIVPVENAID